MEPQEPQGQGKESRVKALIDESAKAAGRGDMFKARDLLDDALAIDPADPMALFALGSLYERLGNNPPGIMARQDLWKDAIKAYEQLMALDARHVDARVHAGNVHLKFGEFEGTGEKAREQFCKAANRLDEAIKLDPTHAGAWYARAFVHLHENQLPAAIDAFARTTALDPKNVEAWWNLGVLQEQQGNYQGALDAFLSVNSLSPGREGLDLRIQKLRIRMEFTRKTRASARNDDLALEHLDIGTRLVKESNHPKAIQFLSKALQHFAATGNITGQLEATRHTAAAYKGLRDWNAARDALESARALAIHKGDVAKQAEAAHNLGYVSYLAGDFNTATRMFEEACALHREIDDKSKLADGLANLGRAQRSGGNLALALRSFEECLQLDRAKNDEASLVKTARDHVEIAETHAAMGETGNAVTHYEDALAIYRQLEKGWKVTEIQGMIKAARRSSQGTRGRRKR
ncbi:MAG: tetratricopeptide repeat protein, partial [Candidatus Lokiarchaeota archaeon]|nr:tetratricopeptide repeat protein [Candidatus Lokiarchaeota archaeon]